MTDLQKFKRYLFSGFIIAAISLVIFSKLAEDVIFNELTNFDNSIVNFVWGFRTPVLTTIMKVFTFLGSAYTVVPITLIGFYVLYRKLKHYWEANLLVITLAGGWLLNVVLKYSFHRQRPSLSSLVTATGYSFPSGHAMLGAVFYGFLAYIFYLNLRKPYRTISVALFAVLVFFIGLSRIYLGVHYPSDVIAGYMAGTFWLASCMLALQVVRYYKSSKKNT